MSGADPLGASVSPADWAARYSTFLLRHRAKVWLAIAAVVAVLAVGLKDFRIDASSDQWLLEDDPDLKTFREVGRDFPGQDFVFVLYAPREGTLFSEAHLGRLDRLVQDLARVDGVSQVFSLLDAPLLEGVDVADIAGELPTLRTPGADLERARAELTSSALFGELLISREGEITGVLVSLDANPEQAELIERRYALLDDETPAGRAELRQIQQQIKVHQQIQVERSQRLIAQVREIIAQHSSDAVELFLGGPAMILVDVIDFATSDVAMFGALALVFFALMLGVLLRRPAWVVIPLGISALVVIGLSGLFGWVGWLPSVVSANYIALLLVLSISLCMHLIVNFQEQRTRDAVAPQQDCVARTLRMMFLPCLFTALTTMVGFGSLTISGILPVEHFGLMMMTGIAAAFVLAFTLMPLCMLSISPDHAEYIPRRAALNSALARWSNARPGQVAAAALLLLGLGVAGIPSISVDNRFIDYFKSDTDIHRGMDAIDRHLGGTLPLDIVLDAPVSAPVPADDEGEFGGEDEFGSEDEFGEADEFGDDASSHSDGSAAGYWFNTRTLQFLERLHKHLDDNPSIGVVRSLYSGVSVAEDLYGRRLGEFELQVLRGVLPAEIRSLLIDDYLSADGNRMRISMRLIEGDRAQNRSRLFADLSEHLAADPFLQNAQVRLSGLAVLYNNMLSSLFDSQIRTIALVFAIIGVMFALLFRSLLAALLGLLPNILAATLVLGTMGHLGVPLDLMTITVVSISVGIAIDNCIHYCYRYRHERRSGAHPEEAVVRAHASIGRAVYYTALIVTGGFALMLSSNFLPTIYFGSFNVLAIVASLLGALTLLPVLLKVTGWGRPAERPAT